MLSIIIPCFNSSSTIKATLDSIVQQNNSEFFEVIIIDDNSPDIDLLELEIGKFKNLFSELMLIKNNENNGGGYTRNVGINLASRDFICFLDSDDIWLDNKLDIQFANYINGTILTSSVLKGSCINSAKKVPQIPKDVDELVSESLFVKNILIQTSTFFMSTDIAKDIMFNPSLPRHQDYDFLLRAEHKGYRIIQMDEPLSFWRVEDDHSGRFLKKKATPEFFIDWYKNYRKYMTNKASISYVAKNIFSACMITKKYHLFISFIFSNSFSFSERIKIIKGILSWRWEKLKK